MDVVNKIVIITGGTKGIGNAIAKLFVNKNYCVVVTSRNVPFYSGFVQKNQTNQQQLDVTSERSVKRFFAWILEQKLEVAILFNNAGVGVFKPMIDLTLAEWQNVLSTNLTGAFLCSKEAFNIMKLQRGGQIINIGSIADTWGLRDNSAYSASKWGLRGLSAVLGEEGVSDNIRVIHISLGAVYTEIWHDRGGFCKEDMLNVDEVAQVIFDVSQRSSTIRIDHMEITPPKRIL